MTVRLTIDKLERPEDPDTVLGRLYAKHEVPDGHSLWRTEVEREGRQPYVEYSSASDVSSMGVTEMLLSLARRALYSGRRQASEERNR